MIFTDRLTGQQICNTPRFLHDWGFNEMRSIRNFQYFIVEEVNSIKIYTFVWHTQKKCSDPQLVEVNAFDKNRMKWKNSEFLIKMFYGCDFLFGYNADRNTDQTNYEAYHVHQFSHVPLECCETRRM